MEETDTELIVKQWYFKYVSVDGEPRTISVNNNEVERDVHRVQIRFNKDEQTYRCCYYEDRGTWRLFVQYEINAINVLFTTDNINNIEIKQQECHSDIGGVYVIQSHICRVDEKLVFEELEQMIANSYEHPLVTDWKLGLALK